MYPKLIVNGYLLPKSVLLVKENIFKRPNIKKNFSSNFLDESLLYKLFFQILSFFLKFIIISTGSLEEKQVKDENSDKIILTTVVIVLCVILVVIIYFACYKR